MSVCYDTVVICLPERDWSKLLRTSSSAWTSIAKSLGLSTVSFRTMGLDIYVQNYRKKLGSHDVGPWERAMEASVKKKQIWDAVEHYQKYGGQVEGKPNKRLKRELIDVDLVRGSTFPKEKPQLPWTFFSRDSLFRILLLPFHREWWTTQTSKPIYRVLFFLYLLEIYSLTVYFGQLSSGALEADWISGCDTLTPLLLSLIVAEILAEAERHDKRITICDWNATEVDMDLETVESLSDRSSVEDPGVPGEKRHISKEKMKRRARRKVRFQDEVNEGIPKTWEANTTPVPDLENNEEDMDDYRHRLQTESKDFLLGDSADSGMVAEPVVSDGYAWHSGFPVGSDVFSSPNVVNSLGSSRSPFMVGKLLSPVAKQVTKDRPTESEGFLMADSADSGMAAEPKVSYGYSWHGIPLKVERLVCPSVGSSVPQFSISKLLDSPLNPDNAGTKDEVSVESGVKAAADFDGMESDVSDMELSRKSQVVLDESTSDKEDSEYEGTPRSSLSLPIFPRPDRRYIESPEVTPDEDSRPRIGCAVWDGSKPHKIYLSVYQITTYIVARAEDNTPSSYHFVLMLIPVLFAFLPVTHGVFQAIRVARSEDRLGWEFVWSYGKSLSASEWSLVVVKANGILQRYFWSFWFFFLLTVAYGTFQQRYLIAKYFGYLTSSIMAKKAGLPHFRLSKVRNVKCWLSVRSCLKKYGPRKSVDVIVSFSCMSCLICLVFTTFVLVNNEDQFTASIYVWEALLWLFAVGLCLLRFMMLGSKTNEKFRNSEILTGEQLNLYLRMEQKPEKKEQLALVNNVLKLAADLIKEIEQPCRISGFPANPFLYNITRLLMLTAFSTLISEICGLDLKLWKLKLK